MAKKILVVGLGYGSEAGLSVEALRRLKQHRGRLFLRTADHPIVPFLQREGIAFASFDSLYEQHTQYMEVYREIARQLLEAADKEEQAVAYAVPGHPGVAEMSVRLLREQALAHGAEVELVPGASFLEAVFARLPLDPVDGFALLDGSCLDASQVNPRLELLLTQVYSREVASDVKLTLMDTYPDEYLLVVANALGVEGEEHIEEIPLFQLDREERFGSLTLIWVPRAHEEAVLERRFERLQEVVATLRGPQGCPWDKEQTHASLRRYLVEEAAEVLDAIDQKDPEHLCEELGDLLLQVMLHAQIASESGDFDMADVVAGLNRKLVRRHPHVFSGLSVTDMSEVNQNWELIKRAEKGAREMDDQGWLQQIPPALPALAYAQALQKKASQAGFDWSVRDEVAEKVREELQEVLAAPRREWEEELGDLLFAVVNLCRFHEVDAESALAMANQKFIRRFRLIEENLRREGIDWEAAGLSKMEALWQKAKEGESGE